MERLTTKNVSGNWIAKTEVSAYDAFDRLAAYEDTSLTPEQVTQLLETSVELTKILTQRMIEILQPVITNVAVTLVDQIREVLDDLEVGKNE